MSGHLVEESLTRIENNLLWVKSVRESIFAWWFNLIIFVIVIGSFGFFLYTGYGKVEEVQKIEFIPRTWNNAVRNVPITDYGQAPQIETADPVPGFAYRTGSSAF
jgi:hypothetical protein